jgi:hypothetical protein
MVSGFVLTSFRGSTHKGEGKIPIRSHVIEASGSSEALYVPPRLFIRCGLVGHPAGFNTLTLQVSWARRT